jgi:GGDEF domain-containing protein
LNTSASVGISVFPDDGQDSAVLMKNADVAMYHAKKAGRSCFCFFGQSASDQ